MTNPQDPVTHEELSALLDEKLEQLRDLLPKLPTPEVEPEDEPEDDTRFTFAQMERFAEKQVRAAMKDLAKKKAAATPPKAEPVADPKVEPAGEPKTEPVVKAPEVAPDPQPGKKTRQEKFWGAAK